MSAASPLPRVVIRADPRPAAAYLLGGHSLYIRDVIDNCANWFHLNVGAKPTLVMELNRMDVAVLDLRDEIEAEVYGDLRAVLQAIKNCLGESFDYGTAVEAWAVMRTEADRALPLSHSLFGWFDLGRTVIAYRQAAMIRQEKADDQRLARILPSDDQPEDPLHDLDFGPLQEKARAQLEKSGSEAPILKALVDLGPTLTAAPVSSLHEVLGQETLFSVCDERNGVAVGIELYRLHEAIYHQLLRLTREQLEEVETPVWDEHNNALLWRGRVIRQFKGSAKNQKDLIEAFHREGWKPSIADPFRNQSRLQKTITDLNKTLARGTIRFGGDGTGEGVHWKPANNQH